MVFIPLVALANAALIVVFNELMTIRTPKGNEVLAESEGLAMYMGTAEKRRLEMFNPPEETPEVFEALLPYAFALGVAETWANRFEDKLKEQQYEPTWYTGANLASFYTGSGIASVTSASAPSPGVGRSGLFRRAPAAAALPERGGGRRRRRMVGAFRPTNHCSKMQKESMLLCTARRRLFKISAKERDAW